jgi:hypothetical protein
MTYYPLFIPIYYGGGGGGRNPKYIALGYIAVLGLATVGFNQITKPKFQMKISKNHYNTNALNVYIRYKNSFPRVKSLNHHNTTSLEKKGYSISHPTPSYYGGVYLSNLSWDAFATIGKKDTPTKSQFTEDCKEANVYTEIIYSYDNFFGNEVQDKKRIYWHKNYVEELK